MVIPAGGVVAVLPSARARHSHRRRRRRTRPLPRLRLRPPRDAGAVPGVRHRGLARGVNRRPFGRTGRPRPTPPYRAPPANGNPRPADSVRRLPGESHGTGLDTGRVPNGSKQP